MAKVELLMPKMGESIMEAKILSWLKKPGDVIAQDESVLEAATDKVDTEVPSQFSGTLLEILAEAGEIVQVGKPIAYIESDQAPKIKAHEHHAHIPPKPPPPKIKTEKSERFLSPLVRNIAKQEEISTAEINAISGSGMGGRITKDDMLSYIKNRRAPSFASGEDEIIEMDRMRQMIASRMLESRRISAHVTSFVETDVTNIVGWRNKVKGEFQRTTGDILTLTPLFIEAVAKAICDYPMINVQVSGHTIIKKKDINIGVAVALRNGNLIVPVIKNADRLRLRELVNAVNLLAKKARGNKLVADDLSGGTFTVSNMGSFGNVMGTPIIMQPQAGIIAFGVVQKKPAVIETPSGDAIAIRHKMFLSHSYDHRVVDGALGGSVLRRVSEYLEKFDTHQSL